MVNNNNYAYKRGESIIEESFNDNREDMIHEDIINVGICYVRTKLQENDKGHTEFLRTVNAIWYSYLRRKIRKKNVRMRTVPVP